MHQPNPIASAYIAADESEEVSEDQDEEKASEEKVELDSAFAYQTVQPVFQVPTTSYSYQKVTRHEPAYKSVALKPVIRKTYKPSYVKSYEPTYFKTYTPSVVKTYQPKLFKTYKPAVVKSYRPAVVKSYNPTVVKSYQPSYEVVHTPVVRKAVKSHPHFTLPTHKQSYKK